MGGYEAIGGAAGVKGGNVCEGFMIGGWETADAEKGSKGID